MASKRVKLCFDALTIRTKDGVQSWAAKSFVPRQRRHLTVESNATETPLESAGVSIGSQTSLATSSLPTRPIATSFTNPFPVISSIPEHIQQPTVSTTLFHFPTLEPLQFINYPSNHLSLPMRKDLLHRAIVYEGDMARQGTAATKHRFEIHGSKRKLYRQKGTGRARVGDSSSPIRRGGGRAFDKKARDFSTGLPRKLYDIAWRTALSYRYARGQLVVVDSLAMPEGEEIAKSERTAQSWIEQVFPRLGWMKQGGGSLLLAALNGHNEADLASKIGLFRGLEESRGWGRGLLVDDVDVKDLLKGERVVVEKEALDWMLRRHQSDLTKQSWAPLR